MGDPPAASTPAAFIGAMSAFQPQSEKIESYLERVELYMMANNFPDDRKVPALLTLIGGETYQLLRSLVAPALPASKTYADLVKVLKKHFAPTPLVIAERFHFHRRSQNPGETIAEYMAELRRLTTHCEFGDYLDQALRDRLVCGLRSESIQKRLLSEADLTLERALTLSQGLEAADLNVKSLKGSEVKIQRVTNAQMRTSAQVKNSQPTPCFRCGRTNHTSADCHFKEAQCHNCGKHGHIAPVCPNPKQDKPKKPNLKTGRRLRPKTGQAKWVEKEAESVTAEEELPIYVFPSDANPMQVRMLLNDTPVVMEVDTGASVSLFSQSQWQELFPELVPRKTEVVLKTYTGEQMDLVGEVDVEVRYGKQQRRLPLVIATGSGPALLGRDWLRKIRLNWETIAPVSVNRTSTDTLESVLKRYESVFTDKLGHIHPYEAKLHVKPEAPPKFHRPRPVPYAIKEAIGEELDRMEVEGIIEKVTHSDWAAPIVAVPKRDGKFRICGDYKVTINSALEVDQYPLPKPEDLFATLAGGQKFTTLDLSQAYLQLGLEEESRKYSTINTHKGLYQFTRLPFGVASSPSIFQKTMDTILEGIPKAMCYIDDILITGDDDVEHLEILAKVLQRLAEHGIQIKLKKCKFMADSVEYLGHRIDAQGIHALPDKLEAISKAPVPKNVGELRSFLGLLNYYRKFLPNLATILNPLNELLQVKRKWKWSKDCTVAFQKAKELLTTSNVLIHYDPTLPVRMAADASAYGIGAVISHVLLNGEEKPIAFASRTLSASERNYAQLEKEALALVFGVRRFHQYLYGRKFTMVTDHRPLTTILGPKKGVPPIAAARLQRWAVQLSAFSYDIEFKPTQEHGNADALSRLPLTATSSDVGSDATVYNMRQIAALPLSNKDVERATRRDPILGKVLQYARKGWPGSVQEALKPYFQRKEELAIEGDCLLWGARVVIPTKLRNRLLSELHQDHPGVSRMKAIARSYLWWPGLDKDLEKLARSCLSCQAVKHTPAVAPLHPWTWPSRPWQRVHIDFAGPFQGKMFLLAVDAHSKWGEIWEMTQTTATKTISQLWQMFATFGLPDQIVSDNGPQFTSEEFREFMQANGIRHIRCSPYHPSSNGLVERFVRTFKEAMKASKHDHLPLSHRLQNFLLTYRTTPHATTKEAPCNLFMGRSLRTRLDLLKPRLQDTVLEKQSLQKSQHDQHARERQMEVGNTVMVRNLRPGEAWVSGVIVKRLGPVTYLVDVGEGRTWKRHMDQLKLRDVPAPENSAAEESQEVMDSPVPEVGEPQQIVDNPVPEPGHTETPSANAAESQDSPVAPEEVHTPVSAAQTGTSPEIPAVTQTRARSTSSRFRQSSYREPYPSRARHQPDWFHARNKH